MGVRRRIGYGTWAVRVDRHALHLMVRELADEENIPNDMDLYLAANNWKEIRMKQTGSQVVRRGDNNQTDE